MSDGLNRQLLLGNLGDAPELRFTNGGQAVLNIRLATTTSYWDSKKEERVERTDWHSVVVWGPRAEALAKILDRGSKVYIEGETRHSSYKDKEGVEKWKTEVSATEVILCGGKMQSEGGGRKEEERKPDDRGSARGRDDDRGRGRDDDRGSGRRDDRRDERGASTRGDDRGRGGERGSSGGRSQQREEWER
jgi:single-strand DNA-binding protein